MSCQIIVKKLIDILLQDKYSPIRTQIGSWQREFEEDEDLCYEAYIFHYTFTCNASVAIDDTVAGLLRSLGSVSIKGNDSQSIYAEKSH